MKTTAKRRTSTLKIYGRQLGMIPEPTPELEKIEDATEFIVAMKQPSLRCKGMEDAWERYCRNVGITSGRYPAGDFVSKEYFSRLYSQFNESKP